MRRGVVLLLVVASVAIFGSCMSPTLIRITITSNACQALAGVDVYVGAQPFQGGSSASTAGCTDKSSPVGSVGSLVVVPSGGPDDHVDIAVVGSLTVGACTSPNVSSSECIVARRAISFVPHVSLELPIFLDAACAGKCTNAGETCVVVQGAPTCKSSSCDEDGGIVCTPDGGAPDVDVPDASEEEASPPQCPSGIDGGAPIVSWSLFTATDPNVRDDKNKFVEPINNNSQTSYLPECGNALHVKDVSQILAEQAQGMLDVSTFSVSFAFRLSQADGPLLTLASNPSDLAASGFIVEVSKGVLDVRFAGLVSVNVLQDSQKLDTTATHTFLMTVKGGTSYNAWVDGTQLAVSGTVPYRATAYELSAGTVEWIDNIAFYP